jgi:hypothetical protein
MSNLSITFLSNPPSTIPTWDLHLENYIFSIIKFANKFLDPNGGILLFHGNDLEGSIRRSNPT